MTAPAWLRMIIGVGVALALAVAIVASNAATTAADSHPAEATTTTFNAATADRAALASLVGIYDQATGVWPIGRLTGWWSSANDLTALVDASRSLGTHQYDALIARTYDLNVQRGADYSGTEFRNHYYDDSEWWGLAWLDAYQWIGDPTYLVTAETVDAYANQARSTTCGGGIPWALPIIQNGAQKGTITNSLALELSAHLATVTGRARYRTEALSDWAWLQRSGLIGADGLVRDHLDAQCRVTGLVWSYNQGVLSGALAALAPISGLPAGVLSTARRLADAATTSRTLNADGTLTDQCETAGWCGVDIATFKGADVRGLSALDRALPDHPYTAYLLRQATMMYTHDRMAGDLYGQHWAGAPDLSNAARQGSAVDLLTAVA